jgi:hypothetical protein
MARISRRAAGKNRKAARRRLLDRRPWSE